VIAFTYSTGSCGCANSATSGASPLTNGTLGDGAAIGSWRNDQSWYRDPQGPCGTESNTSNAVSVQWQ